mmetsp:Transcript_128692/g.191781  ORF Transcript_128692/g.191781 Transcript_128692/m.191781 type:complete len:297 (-) Transcript_128692:75-965(-)
MHNDVTTKLLPILLFLFLSGNTVFSFHLSTPPRSRGSICTRGCLTTNKGARNDIVEEIKLVAQELWAGEKIPVLASTTTTEDTIFDTINEGEADLDEVAFIDRAEHFRREALRGCPKAQHSYALLLWNGFGGVQRDKEASAKFHAAAAYQNHLDGMAVLGGCLRTGTGVKRNVALGLKTIDYCASTGNPTGVNKKAALLEANQDNVGAMKLYEECLKSGRVNALLLFNLGWCLINGQGVDKKDKDRGISLWEEAAKKAPDEGSEEAAWHLYHEYNFDNPRYAMAWLVLAEQLGYHD